MVTCKFELSIHSPPAHGKLKDVHLNLRPFCGLKALGRELRSHRRSEENLLGLDEETVALHKQPGYSFACYAAEEVS